MLRLLRRPWRWDKSSSSARLAASPRATDDQNYPQMFQLVGGGSHPSLGGRCRHVARCVGYAWDIGQTLGCFNVSFSHPGMVISHGQPQFCDMWRFPNNMASPHHHPFQWDFPLYTIYFAIPPSVETPTYMPIYIYLFTICIFGQHHVLCPCLDPARAAGHSFFVAGIAHLARPALCLRGDVWLDGCFVGRSLVLNGGNGGMG